MFNGSKIKMSSKIPIPKSNLTESGIRWTQIQRAKYLNSPIASTYCYIKADEDHHDLEDLFDGEYLKPQEIWRFPKNLEQQVYNFLDCSSSESDSSCESLFERDSPGKESTTRRSEAQHDIVGESVNPLGAGLKQRKRRDRLHRANSFNASDDSNDEGDSLDENFRRHRQSIETVSVESNKLKKEANKY
jgi:hypothetical protein